MYASKRINAIPKHINDSLMTIHDRSPFPYTTDEVRELWQQIKDPSYRIQISPDEVNIFNRDGFHSSSDPFDLFPKLGVEGDGGHAFYLGVELARAQIAWQLGKRYTQDEPLNWGCAFESAEVTVDPHAYQPAGSTLKKSEVSEEPIQPKNNDE